MKMKNFPKLYQLAIRFPVAVLLFLLASTLFSLNYAKKLKVESDLTALLPQETESVQNLKEMKKYFGGRGHLTVAIEGKDSIQIKQFADQFVKRIEQVPEVRYVDYEKPVQFFKDRQWLYVDLDDLNEIERRIDHSLVLDEKGVSSSFNHLTDFADQEDQPDLEFKDIISKYERKAGVEAQKSNSNEEGSFLIFKVKAKEHAENIDASRKLISHLEEIEQEIKQSFPESVFQVSYAGDYQKSIEDADQMTFEISQVSIVVTLLLFVILFFYFRNFSSLFLIGIPLVIGVAWTAALLFVVFGHLSLITAFGAAILSGLGSDYGIYLLTQFYQEKKEGKSFQAACRSAFGSTGQATHASMVITVGGFVALLFSDFGVFVEFGMMGAAGLFANYVAMVLFVPSMLALIERSKAQPKLSFLNHLENFFDSLKLKLSQLGHFLFAPRRPILFISLILILCGLSILIIPQQSKIHFEDGQMTSKRKSTEDLDRKINEISPPNFNPTILVLNEQDEEKAVRKLENFIKSNNPSNLVFNQVLGLSSFVPTQQEEKKIILGRIYRKFEKLKYVLKDQKELFLKSVTSSMNSGSITKEIIPEEVKRNFQSFQDKNKFAVLLFPADASSSSENLRKLHEGIRSLQTELKSDFLEADANFVIDDTIRLIEKEAPKGILLFLIFLAAILGGIVRPLSRAPIIFANLLGGIVLLLGVLWLFNIRLNVMNIALFPIVLGTAIDCFIHFNHRYNETKDIAYTVTEEIPPMFVSSLTSIVGFGGLLLTSSSGLRSIGWVAVIGLVIVTLFCALVFPRCLMIVESLKRAKNPSLAIQTE